MLNFKTKHLSKAKNILWKTKIYVWKSLLLKVLEIKSLLLKVLEIVHLVLREGGTSCSYAFLGICEAIFRGRDLIFCVAPHISIYFTDIKYFFNLDNLEPTPGRPAQLFFRAFTSNSGGCPGAGSRLSKLKKIFYIRKIYTDIRFHTKN